MADVNDVIEKVEPEVEEVPAEEVTVEQTTQGDLNLDLDQLNSMFGGGPMPEPEPLPNPEDETTINCINASPIYTSVVERKGKDSEESDKEVNKVAIITYLCKDDNQQLFIINRAYPVDSEEDQLSFECLPFAEFEVDHITRKIEHKWMTSCLPKYTSDLKFYIDDFNDPQPYIYGIKANDGRKFKIKMTTDIFASLLFLDQYPINNDGDSDHDLDLAIVNAARPDTYNPEFFIVDDMKIIAMADATMRETPTNIFEKIKNKFSKYELVSTDIALITKLYNTNNQVLQLLTPFDVGVVFDDVKYKGKTVENIEDGYFVDGDQYVANLIITDARIYGVDKSYMVIRAINKNKQPKIFLFDELAKNTLNNKINEY